MSTSYGATTPPDDRAGRDPRGGDPRGTDPRVTDTGRTDRRGADEALARDRDSVVAREKEEYGGIKIGSAFFGWLTATGTAVLLTALAAAAGAAFGLSGTTDAQEAVEQATENAGTIGVVGGIVLVVVLFVAYFCGGYVAGRMARFDGAKQGLAVWLWAVVIAIVLALLGLVAGSQFNVLSQLNAFPQIPVSAGDLTTGGVVALVAAAVVSLVGAVLGGIAGMRFHRKVDRAALDVGRRDGSVPPGRAGLGLARGSRSRAPRPGGAGPACDDVPAAARSRGVGRPGHG